MRDPAPNATPAPPWRPEMGPEPHVRTWPPAQHPRLRIRVDGQWRRAVVLARHDWADGRVSYQCDVWMPDPAIGADNARAGSYWWDPQAMRVPGRRTKPDAWRLAHDGHGGVPHRDDCQVQGGGKLDEGEARIALGEAEVRACGECRPERELGADVAASINRSNAARRTNTR